MKPELRIAGLFGIVAAIMVGSVAVAYWIGMRTITKAREVEQHRIAIAVLADTLSTLKDAETGQRGFLLTADPAYRKPFDESLSQLRENLSELHERFPADQLTGLESVIRDKMEELETVIALKEAGQHQAALSAVREGSGKILMDSARKSVKELTHLRETQLYESQRAANRATNIRTAVFAMVVLLNLIFLGWAYNRIRTEITQRMTAMLEGRRQKDLLAVTLASVGDAIILTDTSARIVYMNPVAEKLTGWSMVEALNHACGTVFKIINEESRAVVESPVNKVLREGAIVGLANHTLLIRKDGSEIPIDDSGAPVRESDGTVRGVVLVFRDFSEHKKAETELRNAKEMLEQSAKAKDKFLAILSHELRTPLTPVLATLHLWESGNDLPQDLRGDVVMMRRNIELEARLIDDLLDVTRIVQGKLNLNPELCDVHALLHESVQVYRSEIQAKRLLINLDLRATRHFVTADCARIQQVFWNLLKNASKFTPEGGRIDIRTTNDTDGRIVIAISDNGIGMTPEVIARIFHPFTQGQDDTHRRFGGLGLGLTIARAFVEAHGGCIEASSDGPTHGSTFTIKILAAQASGPMVSPKPAISDAAFERPLRILLVEDHADSAMVIERFLKRMGHSVDVCQTVGSARSKLAEGCAYDLIFSDIGLPDGTGIDLVREIRIKHAWPAVALTGFGMTEDINRCREAGFDAHLTKPVSIQSLEAVIRLHARDQAQPT